MKNLHKIVLVFVSCLLALVMLCGCSIFPSPGKDSNEQSTTEQPDSTQSSGNEEQDPRAEDYSYRPQITAQMPAVRINTTDGSNDFATKYDKSTKDQIEYVEATIVVDNCETAYELEYKAQVKARGNGSLNYSKKAIRIKFDKKQNMLGLNNGTKFKNWVLLADWNDLSMSNNTTAFYLGKTILGSDGYYASDYRNVEVYINGNYWGVYLLVEQQEAKGEDGRTNAPEVEDDYTGNDIGYFFEYDSYAKEEGSGGDPMFEVNYNNKAPLIKHDGTSYNFKGSASIIERTQTTYTVKSDIYADSQLSFLQSYVNNAYTIAYKAVYNKDYNKFNDDYTGIVKTTGTTQEIVSAVIDVQSLVDTYILQEIACDSDISWSSFFLSLDMTENGSKKLIFEAPWDFDLAFGIRKGYEQKNPSKLYAANCNNPWLILLIRENWFQDMIKQKWAELLEYDVLTTALSLIGEQKTTYANYYVKNYERWAERIQNGGEKNQIVDAVNKNKTQADGATYLSNWLRNRFNFINRYWGDRKNKF